jgi:hypothetical protein
MGVIVVPKHGYPAQPLDTELKFEVEEIARRLGAAPVGESHSAATTGA